MGEKQLESHQKGEKSPITGRGCEKIEGDGFQTRAKQMMP